MKIAHLVHSLEEARRNNFGREVSNQQGQNLGKQLAAGDPNAQANLAAAKSAQATNKTDVTGDTLGQTTPAQRLAAKNAANPKTAPTDTTPTPTKTDAAPRDDTNLRNKPLPDAPEGEPAPADATGPTGDPTLDKPLPGQAPQGRGFVKGLANVLGQTGKGIGAVAGGVAGVGRAIKKGYNAGADAVGGPGYSSQVGNTAPAGGGSGGYSGGSGGGASGGGSGGGRRSGGGANLQAINQRLTNVERAVGIAESKTKPVTEFYSKFLGQMI